MFTLRCKVICTSKEKEENNVSPMNGLSPPKSSAAWIEYFRENRANLREIPWDNGLQITASELAEIAESLRAWQLGETSDGTHLRATAGRYAEAVGDANFVEMMELFIAEEQRHGATLGEYLDRAGVPRAQSDWGDTMFRA